MQRCKVAGEGCQLAGDRCQLAGEGCQLATPPASWRGRQGKRRAEHSSSWGRNKAQPKGEQRGARKSPKGPLTSPASNSNSNSRVLFSPKSSLKSPGSAKGSPKQVRFCKVVEVVVTHGAPEGDDFTQ